MVFLQPCEDIEPILCWFFVTFFVSGSFFLLFMDTEGKISASSTSLGSGEKSLGNPSLRITSVVLDGTNYFVWSRSFTLAIIAQGLLGFLTGDNRRPSSAGPELTIWSEKMYSL